MNSVLTQFSRTVLAAWIIVWLPFFVPNFLSAADTAGDVNELDPEALMKLQVTSVSKKAQNLSDAAAAIFVITQEDLRRSGVTSIPEALRMVPGLQVARISANQWAVSSRGFNHLYANKLLVLMDGRTVYSPLFSGVNWDVQDTMLEDIDRIEIIRGPGASLWGANAVNGVINIITKHAQETQGGLVSVTAGTEDRFIGGARYGARTGDDTYVRMYAKYFDRNHLTDAAGNDGADDWNVLRGGFRLDSAISGSASLTLQGDVYKGRAGEKVQIPDLQQPFTFTRIFNDDRDLSGANLLARWKHVFSRSSDMSLQIYYDRSERSDDVFEETVDILDADFQHRFTPLPRNDIIWGAGYRFISDETRGSFPYSLNPSGRDVSLYTAFIQDEITLVEDRLLVTLGSKFEHNYYTGFEVQPTARLAWTPADKHTIWAAASRAVRTPSRSDSDARVNSFAFSGWAGPTVISFNGNPDLKSEELLAYELGYRTNPIQHLTIDIAAFYNVYNNLVDSAPGAGFFESTPPPAHTVYPSYFNNDADADTYGVELAANWRPMDFWRLAPGFTWLKMRIRSDNSYTSGKERESPRYQFNLRSEMDLPYNMEFDTALYYVDDISIQNSDGTDIPSYVRLDARLGWHLRKELELSLDAQNLLDNQHPEFGSVPFTIATEVERSYYGKITWRF